MGVAAQHLPLEDITVLDFSFQLPGPLASLILSRAGARVIKVERPGAGDDLRGFDPTKDGENLGFAMLNEGKQSIALDLKQAGAVARLRPLVEAADIVIEQFRPGVMDRLGLGCDALREIKPNLIYCAVTGYGQTGPDRMKAGHDLNFCADAGILALGNDGQGNPVIPPITIADIAGGTYPAVMNILLALRHRDRTGEGSDIDISMADNLFALQYWAQAEHIVTGRRPPPGGSLLTGGSARYAIYRTSDGRHLAAAPLEQRFWDAFCAAIGLASEFRDDKRDPEATRRSVAARIAEKTADAWRDILGDNMCCTLVATQQEAYENPHFIARGLFDRSVASPNGQVSPALTAPIAAGFMRSDTAGRAPRVGEDNEALLNRLP